MGIVQYGLAVVNRLGLERSSQIFLTALVLLLEYWQEVSCERTCIPVELVLKRLAQPLDMETIFNSYKENTLKLRTLI